MKKSFLLGFVAPAVLCSSVALGISAHIFECSQNIDNYGPADSVSVNADATCEGGDIGRWFKAGVV